MIISNLLQKSKKSSLGNPFIKAIISLFGLDGKVLSDQSNHLVVIFVCAGHRNSMQTYLLLGFAEKLYQNHHHQRELVFIFA